MKLFDIIMPQSKDNNLSPIQSHNDTLLYIGLHNNKQMGVNIVSKIYKEMNNILKNSEPKRSYRYKD